MQTILTRHGEYLVLYTNRKSPVFLDPELHYAIAALNVTGDDEHTVESYLECANGRVAKGRIFQYNNNWK